MICSNCGTANEPNRKFCLECGHALVLVCASCGTANAAMAKFCGECATALPRAAAAASGVATRPVVTAVSVPSAAERRLVSVLFADLVGFTPFAEERDAEDVRDTLTRYFEVARDVIDRYGGTVEKFIGDAVMAVWGAPTAREDDAERAVRAALELVAAVRTLGTEIQARAGVMTGEAAVTIGAEQQGLVAGDLVNTAARLQSVAPPGTVLVGEATHRAASRAIAFEPAGEQVLKGKASPVAAWRAQRVVANRGGAGRSAMPEPPFVGRDEELRVLKDQLAAQARDPRVRTVSITGPGGIGKSRLAWEFEKYVDGLVEPVYWHRGRSPSYGEGITFWALGEMVRQRAGLAESDDEETTRGRIADVVAQFVPGDADRRLVEPALLALLGIEPAPPGGRDVMFAAWRLFFERIAAVGTAVLLFEDVHWADTGLLDFIDHLAEWARGVPILVVTLGRPELFERRATWGAGRRNFVSLALEPLPPQAMRQLLDGFTPGLPANAVSAILARADGIPLYAVETVRSLVADGRLRVHDGVYIPVGDLTDLAIPETLQSLIASRLDALDPLDRALVQDAAVFGQSFAPASLAAISGSTVESLEPRLRALARRELFEIRVDPRSPERGQYAFVQSLIREVAYGTLSRRDRRARHLAVARYFESLGDDELAGALATHYLAAHEASAEGPEAEAIAIQARLTLRAAAARATALGSHEQAVAFLQHAVDVTRQPLDRVELLEEAASNAAAASMHESAIALSRRAIKDLGDDAPASLRARAIGALGRVFIEQGQTGEALAALEEAASLLDAESDPGVEARVLTDFSRALYRSGNPARAIEYVDRALAIADRLNLEDVLADAFNNKGSALSYLGRSREAAALLVTAVEIAETGGFVTQELRARTNLASVTWVRDPARAIETEYEAYRRAERLGNRGMAEWALGPLTAGLYMSARDWDFVLARTTEVLARRSGDVSEGQMLSIRSWVLTARGERDPDALPRLIELGHSLSDRSLLSDAACERANEAALAGDDSTALEQYLEAAKFDPVEDVFLAAALHPAARLRDAAALRELVARLKAARFGESPLYATIGAAGAAVCAALEGRRGDAVAGLRAALPRLRELGYDTEFARFTAVAIAVLGPDEPLLGQAARDATSIYARVGATFLLDQLEQAVSGGGHVAERAILPRSRTEPAEVVAGNG